MAFHHGRENAIKRDDLLVAVQSLVSPDVDDREMRKGYEGLALCGNRSGLYFPATEEERERQIKIEKKKIRAHARRIKALKQYEITDNGQGRLF